MAQGSSYFRPYSCSFPVRASFMLLDQAYFLVPEVDFRDWITKHDQGTSHMTKANLAFMESM